MFFALSIRRFSKRRFSSLPLCLWLLCALLFSEGPLAHSLGESYGLLREGPDEGRYTVTYNMRRDQFLQLAELGYHRPGAPLEIVAAEVRRGYRLTSADTPCEISRFAAMETETFLQASFAARCPGDNPIVLHNNAFFELLPDHLHFVRVSAGSDVFLGERVLDRTQRSWTLPQAPVQGLAAVARRYLRLGVEHLSFGVDHLAFLGSILLLVRGLRPLLLAITGFTVGHSITLALAVLGFAVPDGRTVESLIGLTIALVAAEAAYRRQARLQRYAAVVLTVGGLLVLLGFAGLGPDPVALAGITLFFGAYLLLTLENEARLPWAAPLITAFFGLIHGFGFAGSLLDIGLPVEQLALALLSFNLGIELGQLLILGLLLAALATLLRVAPALKARRAATMTIATTALVAVGSYWFVERGFL